MKEIIFLVHEAEEDGYYAEAAGFGIFAEGDTMGSLKRKYKRWNRLFFRQKRRCS